MTALVDGRPANLAAYFRPGNVFTLTLTWTADALIGRTFTAALGGNALTVDITGDVMTITVSAAITTSLGLDAHTFSLTETTSGADQVIIIGSWVGSTSAATTQSTSVEVTAGTATASVSVVSISTAQEIIHDWDTDGWDVFTQQIVNPHNSATVATSVTDGRGRITGQANSTDGNRRDFWFRAGTEWADSEIVSLIWGGSIYDSSVATPQMGHVHRAVEVSTGVWRAYVVTNNVFGGNPAQQNRNVWETDGSTLTLGSNGNSNNFGSELSRQLTVVSARRVEVAVFSIGLSDLFVSNPNRLTGVASGAVMSTSCTDSSFTYTDLAINDFNYAQGYVQFVDPVSDTNISLAPVAGYVMPEDHRLYWPFWLKTKLVGTVLSVKVWPLGETEPPWTDDNFVGTFDTSGDNDPSPNISAAPTGSGYCGLVSAHLRSSAYLEFGEVTFRQL